MRIQNSEAGRLKKQATSAFFACNRIGHSVSSESTPVYERSHDSVPSLFGQAGNRKYLNAAERKRFLESAQQFPAGKRLFCEVLAWSGARISEVLALTPTTIDLDGGVVSIVTLKRRKRGVVRQVPLPADVLSQLNLEFKLEDALRNCEVANERIWRFSRTTAWRCVKVIMATASIVGTPATPKGLRHGFGVTAFQANVPPHLIQRWLGHASLRTTAIYGDVIGPEERAFAARMWSR